MNFFLSATKTFCGGKTPIYSFFNIQSSLFKLDPGGQMTEIVIYCVCLKGAAREYELYIRCMVCNPPLTSHHPAFWVVLVPGFK